MPASRLIALNNNAGAFVDVLSTIPARRVYVREDESVTSKGLQYLKPDDNFATTYTVGTPGTPDQQQITLPDPANIGLRGNGRLIGMPAQGQVGAFNRIAATKLCSLRSKDGVAGTTVRVVEVE
jgi:hypothetical protein